MYLPPTHATTAGNCVNRESTNNHVCIWEGAKQAIRWARKGMDVGAYELKGLFEGTTGPQKCIRHGDERKQKRHFSRWGQGCEQNVAQTVHVFRCRALGEWGCSVSGTATTQQTGGGGRCQEAAFMHVSAHRCHGPQVHVRCGGLQQVSCCKSSISHVHVRGPRMCNDSVEVRPL